jgi:signal transduction histidine kinase
VRHVPPRTPLAWDVVLGIAAVVLMIVTWSTVWRTHEVSLVSAPAVAAVTAVPVLMARRFPLPAWLVSIVAGGYFWLAVDPRPGGDLQWTVPQVIALFVTVAAVALLERLRVLPLVLGASLVVLVLATRGAGAEGLSIGLVATTVVALLVRWLILSRVQLARQEEVSELERARRAVLEERSRIARDLHDVVAHRMSLVVVQAQSAPARLGSVPPEVAAEFRSISDQAREALNEVRGMLGVLRTADAGEAVAPGAPQHGTGDVEPLLRQTQAAGVDLAWSVSGDPGPVGGAVGLTVYRILQEALANATRHAPGGRVAVRVEYGDPVHVTVRSTPSTYDSSARANGRPGPPGTGLLGMSDRARSVGGTVETGPDAEGGFLVRATLPATARSTV